MESINESTINNRYKIIETKGRGASATVYLAEDINNKKQYAVKVLKEITPSFQKEIQMLEKVSSLKNPYIVNLIEFGEGPIKIDSKPSRNLQYFVLEYASKGEIFDYIYCYQKGLKEKYAKVDFKMILKGVQACHNAGICHRDLKMQNILVDEFFNPKICDFGFATEIKGEDGSGKLDQYLGTLNYAAPEIFLHRPYNGIKVDIFSLGVVLINLVTCKIGFLQATRRDKYYRYIMIKNYNKYWNSVKDQIGEMSEDLKTLYLRMVSFNPDERPTIEEILKDPWMKEINDLNESEYKILEKEVFEDFIEREKKVIENNEEITTNSSSYDYSLDYYRSLTQNEKKFFSLDISPKYNLKTGLNMNNYVKINGNLNPHKFMNLLVNRIMTKFGDNCTIDVSKKALKFNVIFEAQEEEDNEQTNEEDKKTEEELDKLGLENIDDFEDVIEKKDSKIRVKLFESVNGGYIIRFVKKGGEIEDYHKNLDNIIAIIKQLLLD